MLNRYKDEQDRNRGYTRRDLLLAGSVGLVTITGGSKWAVRSSFAASTEIRAEAGAVTTTQPDRTTGHSVSLEDTYDDPVVIMKPVSMDGHQPVHVRLGNVSSDSFVFKFEEWGYQDGAHVSATVHYMVLEAGSYTLPNGTVLEAGTVEADEEFTAVRFGASFSRVPVVFSQAQTFNGSHEIVTRNRRVSMTEFELRVQEEEGRDGQHMNERIGYVAIEPTVTNGFEVGRTGDTVTDDWHAIGFEQLYDSPILLADMQTQDGPDTAGLRYKGLKRSSVNVRVEEEESADSETHHTTEQIGYLVTTPGELFNESAPDSGATILEDFNDTSLSRYQGSTDGFTFETAEPIEGDASLRGDTDGAAIATNRIKTPRGYEYRCRIVPQSDSYQQLLVNVQDTSSPMSDCYALFAGGRWNDIAVQDRQGGSRADFVNASHSFSAGTEYIMGVSVMSDGVWATLYDADENQLAQTPLLSSTTHSGGHLGFGVGPATGVLWDEVRHVDPGSPPSSETGSDEYYTGDTLYASDYGSHQAAIDAASSLDTVVLDVARTEGNIRAKTDVRIQGDESVSRHITIPGGSNAHGITIYGGQNIHIDNVHIDGNRANNSAGGHGIGGPGGNEPFSNIRVTNCDIVECDGNGITFLTDTDGGGEDLYIYNNRIVGVDSHGIVIGGSEGGDLRNVIVEGNYIDQIDQAQGIGVFGHTYSEGGLAENVAILGNNVSTQTQSDRGGQCSSFEERTRNMVSYGNTWADWNRGSLRAITKAGTNNLVVQDECYNSSGSALNIVNFDYFDNGPPTKNLMARNYSHDNDAGMRIANCGSNSQNVFYNNKVENNGTRLATPGTSGGFADVNNNSNPGVSDVGTPDSIGDSIPNVTYNGQVVGSASWDRGSMDPSDPVQVSVSVDVSPFL